MPWARLNRPPTGAVEIGPGPLEPVSRAMETLTSIYAAPPWQEEAAKARQEFERRRGKVYEDEPMFEAQLRAYLEWYVLDRRLPGSQAPVVRALQESCARQDQEASQAYRALALNCHSLFEAVEVMRRETLVHDLLRGGLWRVRQEPPLPGVEPDDIFEGRLLPWEGEVRFGQLFCFHPRAARRSILEVVHTLSLRGPLGVEVLNTLAIMRLNHERFRNIAIERIYSLSWRGSGAEAKAPGGPEVGP
jgi:hypothetical protein